MDTFLPKGFDQIFETATKNMVNDARIKAVLIAYDAALADPKANIPTSLHAAIEGLRRA
jgi:hypothetical protein